MTTILYHTRGEDNKMTKNHPNLLIWLGNWLSPFHSTPFLDNPPHVSRENTCTSIQCFMGAGPAWHRGFPFSHLAEERFKTKQKKASAFPEKDAQF